MAYDQELAGRVSECLDGTTGIRQRRMFGGLAFLVHGNMAVAATGRGLMVRVDPQHGEALVDGRQVVPVVMRGRPMRGWLDVGVAAVAEDDALREWVARGVGYAGSLPPKRPAG